MLRRRFVTPSVNFLKILAVPLGLAACSDDSQQAEAPRIPPPTVTVAVVVTEDVRQK